MATPEPDIPEEDEPITPLSRGAERADWLLEPDQGSEAELRRVAGQVPPPGVPPLSQRLASLRRDESIAEGFLDRPAAAMEHEIAPEDPSTAQPAGSTPVPPPAGDAQAKPGHATLATRGSEPWWRSSMLRVHRDRRVRLALGAAVMLALGIWIFWPRPYEGVSIGRIQREPQRFDGRVVAVSGRVGETFPVGAGYAFYLHQGRDTIVVFTRSRVPTFRQRVQIVGSVSTGFLEGVPRAAIFEAAK